MSNGYAARALTGAYLGTIARYTDKPVKFYAIMGELSSGDVELANLSSVRLGTGVNRIGVSAFSGCETLKRVDNVKKLQVIKSYAFNNARSLSSIQLQDSSVSSIQSYAFSGSGLVSAEMPATLKSIGQRAFLGNSNLTGFYVPEGNAIEDFGGFCFYYCYNLHDVPRLPAKPGNAKNDWYHFRYAMAITPSTLGIGPCVVKIPDTWGHIPQYMFSGTAQLSAVEIPPSVNEIYVGAFADGDDPYKINGEAYSPMFNGLRRLVFRDRTLDEFPAVSKYTGNTKSRGTMSECFSGCSWLSSIFANKRVGEQCKTEEVKSVALDHLSPFVELDFVSGDSVDKYLYVKDFDPISADFDWQSGELTEYLSSNYLIADDEMSFIASAAAATLSARHFISRPSAEYELTNTYFGDVETIRCCQYESAYVDLSSVYDRPAIASVQWLREKRPTVISYSDGTSEQLYHEATFTSSLIDGRASEITSIQFGKYTTHKIDENALRACSGLVSAYIPATVYSIGRSAFYGCPSLTGVTFEHSRSAVMLESAFAGCSALQSLSSEYNMLQHNGESYFQIKGSSMNNSVLQSCQSLSSALAFPEAVRIHAYTTNYSGLPLANCKSVSSLYFPQAIGFSTGRHTQAFYAMTSLKYLGIPEMESIDCAYAFRNASAAHISVDFGGRTKQSIPAIVDSSFFKTDSKTTKDFTVYVPYVIAGDTEYKAYGNWCVDDSWARYAGDFTCADDPGFTLENATADLYQEYAFEDCVIQLSREDGKWMLGGKEFEGNYGNITTSVTADVLAVSYTRGRIVPIMAG